MKWITRVPVKVDRVACPWLIRKFVDPEVSHPSEAGTHKRGGWRWLTTASLVETAVG